MSDLRSEMVNKVLNSWENPSMQTKQSFGERVHDYVKAHPYCTIAEVKAALDVNDTQSTASTLKTLYDRGIVNREEKPVRHYPGFGRRTQWEYYSISDSYETKNQGYWKPKGTKRGRPLGSKNAPKLTQAEHIEKDILAPILDRKLAKSTYTLPRMRQFANVDPLEAVKDLEITKKPFVAEDFIEGLSVTQAKAVYLALRAIFDSRLHG
jgi:hypothetical protein